MLTQKRLKELFFYDEETGLFTRLVTVSNNANKGDIPKHIDSHGYYDVRIDCKLYRQHRLAWLYVTGKFPEEDTDHINHIRTDNRFKNLRSVSRSSNMKNSTKRNDNTSGTVGIWWHKKNKKWCAEISSNGKKENLGSFTDKKDAITARKAANIKYKFHSNHGK